MIETNGIDDLRQVVRNLSEENKKLKVVNAELLEAAVHIISNFKGERLYGNDILFGEKIIPSDKQILNLKAAINKALS